MDNRCTVSSKDPIVAAAVSYLGDLLERAKQSGQRWDDWQDTDEHTALLPNASDDEGEDDAGSEGGESSGDEMADLAQVGRPWWLVFVDFAKLQKVISQMQSSGSWCMQILLHPRNLKWVFVGTFALQLLLHGALFAVQQHIEDTGLFILLLLLGAVLLGLQSGQGLEHFRQEIKSRKNNLLYKTTKRLTFHGKMIFYPMMVCTSSKSFAIELCVCICPCMSMQVRTSPTFPCAIRYVLLLLPYLFSDAALWQV